jgi:hypothetical protein
MGGLYGDGIIACKGAFERAWVARLGGHRDPVRGSASAGRAGRSRAGRTAITSKCTRSACAALPTSSPIRGCRGLPRRARPEGYKVVEAGFDVPGPGAHAPALAPRFPSPEATLVGRRLNSLAFNITTVDVTEDMGPFEIAPGTQWDDLARRRPDVPGQGRTVAALRGARPAQAAEDGRHLGALGADHPPRHRQPSRPVAAGVRARRGRPGRAQRRQARPAAVTHAYYEALPEAVRAPPDLPRGRLGSSRSCRRIRSKGSRWAKACKHGRCRQSNGGSARVGLRTN